MTDFELFVAINDASGLEKIVLIREAFNRVYDINMKADDIVVKRHKDYKKGDRYTPVCKQMKDPTETATKIADAINEQLCKHTITQKVIAENGFINFYDNPNYYKGVLHEIL